MKTAITQAENSKLLIKISLPEGVFGGFEQALDFLKETTQQIRESLAATGENAANIITTATEQTVQKADQLSGATSNAIQTAISDSVSEWLQDHPLVLRLVQMLLWATNHPIVSLIILLFTVAIAWSLIKALGRLIEMTGWSLLQAPFKLGQVLLGVSAKSLGKFGGLAVKRAGEAGGAISGAGEAGGEKDKQQRLAEISTRLETIQKEQNELLQEVAAILASDK